MPPWLVGAVVAAWVTILKALVKLLVRIRQFPLDRYAEGFLALSNGFWTTRFPWTLA